MKDALPCAAPVVAQRAFHQPYPATFQLLSMNSYLESNFSTSHGASLLHLLLLPTLELKSVSPGGGV
jgi:hypothetical protein